MPRKLLGLVSLILAFLMSASLWPPHVARAQEHARNALADTQKYSAPVASYTLPRDSYEKAHRLSEIEFWSQLASFPYVLLVLWIFLEAKWAPKFRNIAEKLSKNRGWQVFVFSPLFILTAAFLTAPLEIFKHQLSRAYDLSVQSWSSWAADWAKTQCINLVLATFVIAILYFLVRRSPRRWWLYFWFVSLPLGLCLVYLQPLILDPMFHRFEPLAQRSPALVASLEEMSRRAGVNIPPGQMFWMDASTKTNELNAYVNGVGASKRIVVWDTTLAKMSDPQIVFIAAHEMGHYVLHHIPQQLALGTVLLLILLYAGFRSMGWILERWGDRWQITRVEDWASLPVLLLPLFIFSFLANPVESFVSRHYEHQADQYALEITHGLTPDSAQVAAQSFQFLGELDLADPAPNRANVFLFYSHPPIADRIRFALTYNPWAKGQAGEFIH